MRALRTTLIGLLAAAIYLAGIAVVVATISVVVVLVLYALQVVR